MDGVPRTVPASSVSQAETLGLLTAVSLLEAKKEEDIVLESHCMSLVRAVNSSNQGNWEMEAHRVMGRFKNISLAHCIRDSNSVTDWICKARGQKNLSSNWVS